MSRATTKFAASLLLTYGLISAGATAEEVAGRAVYLQTLKGTGRIDVRLNGKSAFFGTGWIIDFDQRLMVTNHHVAGVDGAALYVTFPAYDKGRPIADKSHYKPEGAIAAKLLDTDPKRDLAVLQLERLPAEATALALAPESPLPGDRLFLVGNPGVSDGYWVLTSGAVRQVVKKKGRYENGQRLDARVIETNMAFNRGDSGSAVVNDKGEVVGVTSAFSRAANIMSWAIERSEVSDYLAEVRALMTPDTALAEHFHKRGVRCFQARRLDQAIADFTEALQRDDTLAAAYCGRGTALYLKGDKETALADLDEAVRLDPKDHDAWEARGAIYSREKAFDKAIADLTQALRLKPNDGMLYLQRGLTQQAKGANAEALRDFSAALKIDPRDPLFLTQRGYCLIDSGHLEQAAADFTEALKSDPNDAGALDGLGEIAEARKELDKADRLYKEAIKLAPALEPRTKVFATSALTVANKTGQPIKVCATFETLTKDGQWQWLPAGGKQMFWMLDPGETTPLYHPGGRVECCRVRIWATTPDGQRLWETHRHQDLTLLRGTYRLRSMPTYVYSFEP